MTIERVIDGKIYEFPEGTPEATIRRFTLNKAGTPDATAPVAPVRPQAKRPDAMLPGAAGQALQGLTMGFSDEAIARLRSLGGNQSYEDLVKAEREGLRKYAEENPRTAVASELGGALVPALFTGGAGAIPAVSKAVGPQARWNALWQSSEYSPDDGLRSWVRRSNCCRYERETAR